MSALLFFAPLECLFLSSSEFFFSFPFWSMRFDETSPTFARVTFIFTADMDWFINPRSDACRRCHSWIAGRLASMEGTAPRRRRRLRATSRYVTPGDLDGEGSVMQQALPRCGGETNGNWPCAATTSRATMRSMSTLATKHRPCLAALVGGCWGPSSCPDAIKLFFPWKVPMVSLNTRKQG